LTFSATSCDPLFDDTAERSRGRTSFAKFTPEEIRFFKLGLTQRSRERANEFSWGIEAAACIAWALRLLPRIWPMDEQFDGKLDGRSLSASERRLVETATLRPLAEIEAARERIKLWHWRARQLALERQGTPWPPTDASPEAIADLRNQGLDSLDGLVRAGTRILLRQGKLDESIDDDFVAKGKAYRALSNEEASELMSFELAVRLGPRPELG